MRPRSISSWLRIPASRTARATRSRPLPPVPFPSAAREEWHRKSEEDFEADYTLQFVHGGRVYRGRLRNFGDWYDVERLTQMINRALEEAGSADRFMGVASNDQFASRFFAPPDAAAQLARTLSFELESDPAAAMKAGKRFEEKVRRQNNSE